MSEELDLDKIEEDLKQISSFPWRLNEHMNISNIYDSEIFFSIENDQNGAFIAKSPERQAALVKRVRELEGIIKDFYSAKPTNWLNGFMDAAKISSNTPLTSEEKNSINEFFWSHFKRGSDEV